MEKINSGLEALNRLTSGGLPKGFIVLCKGKAGTGKTLLLREFLIQGMKEKSLNIYILPNKNPLNVIEVMQLYNQPVSLENTVFFVLQGIVNTQESFIKGNYSSLMDLLIDLKQFLSTTEARDCRLIIENLSSVFIGSKEETVFDFLKQLFVALRKKQVTTLIEVQSDALDDKTLA
ncbi:DUF2075 domain-containing protein, partial [archaeon]|nr:DUF2075 domain-containing protein [archaeon]